MIEFIREFPILSLFILDCIIGFIGSRYYDDKPKYYRIADSMVFAGLAVLASADILILLW